MHNPALPQLTVSGLPPITLILLVVAAASLPGLEIGIIRFRHRDGEILTLASGLILFSLMLVVAAVIFTVWSGSMG